MGIIKQYLVLPVPKEMVLAGVMEIVIGAMQQLFNANHQMYHVQVSINITYVVIGAMETASHHI